jgi:multidrug efflux system outer membrane protein
MSERFQRIGVWLSVPALALLAGCAVGPNYRRPAVDSPAVFRGDHATTNASLADLDWWEIYQDDTLRGLIRQAFTNNYDLRIALTRVEQSRAVAQQARAQFVPSVTYNGSVSRGRNDFLGSVYPNNGAMLSSAATTLNAFWEVDLWGRVRRLNESARAQFLATEEAR